MVCRFVCSSLCKTKRLCCPSTIERGGVRKTVLLIFLSFYDDTVRFGKEIVPLLKQMDVVKSMDAHPVALGL